MLGKLARRLIGISSPAQEAKKTEARANAPVANQARDSFARNHLIGTPAMPPPTVPSAGNAPANNAMSLGRSMISAVRESNQNAQRELEMIQQATVASARCELDAGVGETAGNNRGARVDQYAREAYMTPGQDWCGFFNNWNISQASKELGVEWKGFGGMASRDKARSYFMYHDITNPSMHKTQQLDDLREKHASQGSTRRFMTFAGSEGEAFAKQRSRPHESFQDHSELPIRGGDIAIFKHSHVGTVESYNRETGKLTTIEGNTAGGKVRRMEYDLTDPAIRAKFEGFGRPARGDFQGILNKTPDAEPSAQQPQTSAPAQQPQTSAPAPAQQPQTSSPSVPAGQGASGSVEAAEEGGILSRAWDAVEDVVDDVTDGVRDLFGQGEASRTPQARTGVAEAAAAAAEAGAQGGAQGAAATEGAQEPAAPQGPDPTRLGLPPRPADAMSGSEFFKSIAGLPPAKREQAILDEIMKGNVPDFMRQMKELDVTFRGQDGVERTGKVRVMPDYLAVGSGEDFVRVPITPMTAQKIADSLGAALPTKKVVDTVYDQAEVKLQPYGLNNARESTPTFEKHNKIIEGQREGKPNGALTVGHKKDIINSRRAQQHPDKVCIYGWHQPNGEPIQPLSTVHHKHYIDYSHGVRLMGGTVQIDGQEIPVAQVMSDPNLAGLLSHEGTLPARLPN